MLLRIGSKCLNIGADGDVLEITFTIVKVQNFDNTSTTIPTYSIIKVQNFDNATTIIPIYPIINECFKNWRNKNLSGGGRIKRFANIVIMTV